MTDAPDRIGVWTNEPNGEPVVSYPDQPYPSGAVEYTRARPMTVAEAAKVLDEWLHEGPETLDARMVSAFFNALRKTEGDEFTKVVSAFRALSQGGE